jgi:hypothetical protein
MYGARDDVYHVISYIVSCMWDHFFSIMDVLIKRGEEGCPPKIRSSKGYGKGG